MKVAMARLSGRDYAGAVAAEMYAAVQGHPVSSLGADFYLGPRGARYAADVDVSGVSASFALEFADERFLREFINGATVAHVSEDLALAAYRKLLALVPANPETEQAP